MAKEFKVGEVVMVDSYPRYAGRVEGIAQKVERFACKDETMLYYLIKKNWRKSEWVRQTEVAEIIVWAAPMNSTIPSRSRAEKE